MERRPRHAQAEAAEAGADGGVMANDPEFCRLLSGLGHYQAQIEAELAKGDKADHDKIAAAFAAGKDFARDAAPYCHPPGQSAGPDGGVALITTPKTMENEETLHYPAGRATSIIASRTRDYS
jgi:hypothetical protein